MGWLALLALLVLGDDIPRAGPPAESPPAGAAMARPGEARKLALSPREPEDWALMVPRALLAVPRVALLGVVVPVSHLLSVFDDRTIARIRRVFLWNRAETIGWRPLLQFQGGYGLSGGVRLFHEDLFGHEEQLDVDALVGGIYLQAYQLRFHGGRIGGSRVWLDTRGRYDVSPRLVFAGVGTPPRRTVPPPPEGYDPRLEDRRTRYSQRRGLAALRVGYGFGPREREIRPGLGLIYNHRRFGQERGRRPLVGNNGDDPSLEDVYDVDRLVGFDEGADVVRLLGSFEVDARNRRGRTSRGLHFVALGGGAPPQMRNVAFGYYGSEVTGYFNLLHHSRIFVARMGIEAVHGPDDRIPFSELPRLGGPLRLRGYRLGTFRDRRALFGTLEYRYPIHQILAGHLFVDAGRVARTWSELRSGDLRPWRLGFGGGFTVRTLDRWYMRIDIAYGDELLVFFSTDPLRAFADHYLLEL